MSAHQFCAEVLALTLVECCRCAGAILMHALARSQLLALPPFPD